MGIPAEISLTPKEIDDLKDFLQLGISMGGAMGKNTFVLKKLLQQVLNRIPEGQGIYIGPKKPDEPDGYMKYVGELPQKKKEDKSSE